MSYLNLKNDLGWKKAKKVCQKLATPMQSKLQKLRRSRTMEQATVHLNSAIIWCKKKLRKKLKRHHHHHHHHHHHQHEYKIYWYGTVDEACYSSTATVSEGEGEGEGEVEAEDVNVRSDIFIAMNKELWKLESQRSIENLWEMLARGM